MHTIVGLGNPGEQYEDTRHNAGRQALEAFHDAAGFPAWHKDGRANALVSEGEIDGASIRLVLPEGYMNNSGKSVAAFVKNEQDAKRLIVLYDELDIGIGDFKISFNRGAGGHNGVKSIVDAVGTKQFTRIRIGISPVSLFGSVKKPKGEQKVLDFILKPFTSGERKKLEAVYADVATALKIIVVDGYEKAMNRYN